MKILPVPMPAMGPALLPSFVQAESSANGKVGLELRNFYFNHDHHQPGAGQSYSEEWVQGLLLRCESGYIEGLSGLGVGVLSLLGVRLGFLPERSGSGLLLYPTSDRRAARNYSSLGLAAKL